MSKKNFLFSLEYYSFTIHGSNSFSLLFGLHRACYGEAWVSFSRVFLPATWWAGWVGIPEEPLMGPGGLLESRSMLTTMARNERKVDAASWWTTRDLLT